MAKKKGGRPTVMTDGVLAKLKLAFAMGLSDVEACAIADIEPTSLYRYQKRHKGFASEKAAWKENVKAKAKMVVAQDIINKKNVKTAQWYLEHKDPDFNPIQQLEVTVPTFVDDVPKEDDVDGYGNTKD